MLSKAAQRRGIPLLFVLILVAVSVVWFFQENSTTGSPRPDVDRPAEEQAAVPSTRHAVPSGPGAKRPTLTIGTAGVPGVEDNNRATELLAAGELEEAVALFEAARRADAENAIYRGNLAEALVRLALADHERGDVDAAVVSIERAVGLIPEHEDIERLRGLLDRWRAELEVERDHFTEDSDLFELSFDADRSDLLHASQRVLDSLESSYERLRVWFGRDIVREGLRPQLRVVLYRAGEFQRVTGLGDWAGGAFDGVVRVSVDEIDERSSRWERVAAHELVHAFVDVLGGDGVPGWLGEGLAQLLAEEDPGPALERADEVLGAAFFPLARLGGSLATWNDPKEIAKAYAESLLVVGTLRAEYGDESLRRMVAGCGAGIEPAVAFEAYTQVPLTFAVGLVEGR